MVKAKQKLGLGVSKKQKRPSSKEISWQQKLEELLKPSKRDFTLLGVIVNHIDEI